MPTMPPAGLSPASAFDIEGQAEQVRPPAILADLIDAKTGEFLSLTKSARIADGMVTTLLRTQRGSGAAVQSLGQRFRELRHVTQESPELVASLAREALEPARAAGVAQFTKIAAEVEPRDGTQVNTGIDYVDLLAPSRKADRTFTFNE